MKVFIKVDGKDSISNGVSKAVVEQLKATKGLQPGSDAWEARQESITRKYVKTVGKFVVDGTGGNDSTTLEIDLDEGTCRVVPVAEARKIEKDAAKAAEKASKDAQKAAAKSTKDVPMPAKAVPMPDAAVVK